MRAGLVRSYFLTRRSAGAFLLIGVLAGVSVGGGIGVIAASSAKTVTVCANKKTSVLRYAKNGTCAKTETKVLLNQTVEAAGPSGAKGDAGTNGVAGAKGDAGTNGVAGAKGDAGTNGVAGAKGDAGANGADGTNGVAGAKGDAGADGAPGVAGTNGVAGAKGDTGTNGTNGVAGAKGDLGVAGTNGIGSFVPRSVCGSNGITLCAYGLQGPGGGWIFYVDTEGKYSDFDYLEAAPTVGLFASSTTNGVWSKNIANCGLVSNQDCRSNWLTTSGDAIKYWGLGTGRAATAAIVARHDAGGVAKNLYAAGVADAYTSSTATDWWLPSTDELILVYELDENGFGNFGNWYDYYWSSTELDADSAWVYYDWEPFTKSGWILRVRPVRSF